MHSATDTERRLPLLVTGGQGMLGSYLSGHRLLKLSHLDFDFTDTERVKRLFSTERFSAVLHLAAITKMEACEENPREAFRVNVQGTQLLAQACAQADIPMVYISSAGVFGKNPKARFIETDTPSPITVHHQTKYQGELAVQKFCPRYFILRIGWLMGGVTRDHKFVGVMNRLILDSTQESRTIPVVNDTHGSLLYAKDLVEKPLWEILRKGRYGIYHVANRGYCSRFDIAQELKKNPVHRKCPVEFVPVNSQQLNLKLSRPHSEMLDCSTWNSLHAPLRSWKKALNAYLEEWRQWMDMHADRA